jgi:hypothetical protein
VFHSLLLLLLFTHILNHHLRLVQCPHHLSKGHVVLLSLISLCHFRVSQFLQSLYLLLQQLHLLLQFISLIRLIISLFDHNLPQLLLKFKFFVQMLNFVLHRLESTLPLVLLRSTPLEHLLKLQLVMLLNANHFLIMLGFHIHDDLTKLVDQSFSLLILLNFFFPCRLIRHNHIIRHTRCLILNFHNNCLITL